MTEEKKEIEQNVKNEDESHDKEILSMIEAVIFMYGVPVKELRLAEILERPVEEIREAIEKLKKEYDDRKSGLSIMHVDEKVQIVTSKEQTKVIEKFTKKELEGDLSQAALEVLAIVAYRGPITKPDIESIRGVNCSFTIRNLLLRGLISKKSHPTDYRTQIYSITPDFYRFLGISSKKELPDFEKLAGDYRIDAILYNEKKDDEKESSDELDDLEYYEK